MGFKRWIDEFDIEKARKADLSKFKEWAKEDREIQESITAYISGLWSDSGNTTTTNTTNEPLTPEISKHEEIGHMKACISSRSPEEQRELYEYMYNTLGLRIYK